MSNPVASKLLKPTHNCWRVGRADRLAFLIDGEEYFTTLWSTLQKARKSIFIVAWDLDSRVELMRDGKTAEWPTALGDFLNTLIDRQHALHIYVLVWDFAMLYALEREWMPIYKLDWRTHRRLHICMDDKHPRGASHHQKIVIADDKTAFVGGFDLTRSRWDTSAHKPNDPRRVNPYGLSYAPFHDVQVVLQGNAATALAELARERWHCATGEWLPLTEREEDGCWPSNLRPDIEDVEVGIARTQPAYENGHQVLEVERLNLDAIAAARRHIYIESEYLTSAAVSNALQESLRRKDGPEIVIVLPKETAGWLEQATMDVLRARTLKELREANRHGRLRVYYPDISGLRQQSVNVHAKVMIVDDVLARVGSSNLSNRSMRLDTECDIAIESAGDSRIAHAIKRFRNRLVAEHLGMGIDALARVVEEKGSLIRAIDNHRDQGRSLRPLEGTVPRLLERELPEASVIDPEEPMDPDRLVNELLPDGSQNKFHGWWLFVAVFIALLAMAAAWRWTPLGDFLDVHLLDQWLQGLKSIPLGHVATVLIFVLASLLAVPVTVLIVLTALMFGPFLGFVYSLVGVLVSSTITYALGRLCSRNFVRRMAGSRINKLTQQLSRRGLISILIVRIVPVAPFVVVNLVAGASHMGFREFGLGTLLGMTPGLAAMTIFADRVYVAATDPSPWSMGALTGVAVFIIVGVGLLQRWLKRKSSA